MGIAQPRGRCCARPSDSEDLGAGGTVSDVAIVGNTAPGTGGGTYSGFGQVPIVSLSNSGQVAFYADVIGGTVSAGIGVTFQVIKMTTASGTATAARVLRSSSRRATSVTSSTSASARLAPST